MKKLFISTLLALASSVSMASVGANPNAVIATLVDGTIIYASLK